MWPEAERKKGERQSEKERKKKGKNLMITANIFTSVTLTLKS